MSQAQVKTQKKAQVTKAKTAKSQEAVTKKEVKDISKKYNLTKLLEEYKTKSAIIRLLTSEDYTRSEIATFMGIRYQHVRNVQLQVLKTNRSK